MIKRVNEGKTNEAERLLLSQHKAHGINSNSYLFTSNGLLRLLKMQIMKLAISLTVAFELAEMHDLL